jgi:hypothetical protein
MKTVAIVGNASLTRSYAPFENEHIEIWGMSIHAYKMRRCDAVLEVHDDVLKAERWMKYPDCEAYRAWLQETTIPVWMQKPEPLIPAAVRYPREMIEQRYVNHLWKGKNRIRTFFGGTASFGVALALYAGFERVELYGVELNSRPEYDDERDCLFFWIGRAEGLGVEVAVHEESKLLREILYP